MRSAPVDDAAGTSATQESSGHPPRLRILVCPHELITGGSQLNAIDLAARIRDRGHTVEIYAPPGPLVRRIASFGLTYRPAPAMTSRSLRWRSLRGLAREIRRFQPDIVHAYEFPPAIASAAVYPAAPHRSVVTILSMGVPDFIPEDVPLIVGTADLANDQSRRRGVVRLMEPPIDPDADSPRDAADARAELGIAGDQFVVAVVGRLSSEHEKALGVINAMEALASSELPGPVTLIVAGAGDRWGDVRRAAAAVRNPLLTVRIEGDVADPRPIYAAAHVVFGMGGSALRAMSHARPLIVQGTDGFWETLSAQSVDRFLAQGFFGQGPSGGPAFHELVSGLMHDDGRRDELGRFGRDLVLRRFAIDRAARELEELYLAEVERHRTIRSRPWSSAHAVALARYGRFRASIVFPAAQRVSRWVRGRRD